MLKAVSFAVKVQLNVHDLNNEAVAGNVTDIRVMEYLDSNGKRQEAPAVSGRMLKHWHQEAMTALAGKLGFEGVVLCAGCRVSEPIRPGKLKKDNVLEQDTYITESSAVTGCVICDIHGYLIAKKGKKKAAGSEAATEQPEAESIDSVVPGEQEGGEAKDEEKSVSARRSSRAMFSWLMPEIETPAIAKQVIHNRVSADPASMMPFSKSYASGIYGFVSALDVERIGLVEARLGTDQAQAVTGDALVRRVRLAIEAYRYLLSGQMGASLSHAVPHVDPVEVLVAYSETGPLPFPVSPIYADYLKKTKGLMPGGTHFLLWNAGRTPREGIIPVGTIDEIFAKLKDSATQGNAGTNS